MKKFLFVAFVLTSNFGLASTEVETPSTLDLSQLQDLPKQIDLSPIMTSIKQQGERGSCSFFTLTGIAEAAIKKDLGLEANLSEEYMNYAIKTLGTDDDAKDEGSFIHTNIKLIQKTGLFLESDFPYQPSWFEPGTPCEKFANDQESAPPLCIAHIRPNKNTLPKMTIKDSIDFIQLPKKTNVIIEFLATEQRPVSIAVDLNDKGWPDTGDVTFTKEMEDECEKDESVCSAHAFVLTGYDMDKKVFFFKNSWGESWGKKGYGTIPFKYVDKYGNDFYSAKTNKALVLPTPNSRAQTALKDFSLSIAPNKDQSLNIDLHANIENVNGQTIYISSYLVKTKDSQSPDDQNASLVSLPNGEEKSYPRVLRYYFPRDYTNSLELKSLSGKFFTFPSEYLNNSAVQGLKKAGARLFIRTTVYYYTDDGYKVLKRDYTAID